MGASANDRCGFACVDNGPWDSACVRAAVERGDLDHRARVVVISRLIMPIVGHAIGAATGAPTKEKLQRLLQRARGAEQVLWGSSRSLMQGSLQTRRARLDRDLAARAEARLRVKQERARIREQVRATRVQIREQSKAIRREMREDRGRPDGAAERLLNRQMWPAA